MEQHLHTTRLSSRVIAALTALTLAGCNADGSFNQQKFNEAAGQVLGAAGGAALGSQIGSGSGRTVAIALGAIIGAKLGGEFANILSQQDQQRMDAAATEALTTGKTVRWENKGESTYGRVSTKAAAPIKTSETIRLIEGVDSFPLESSINQVYTATTSVNVRSGPGTSYNKVASLMKGKPIQVKGKVQGQSWYLVEQGNIGFGYVHSNYLTPWKAPKQVASAAKEEVTVDVPAQPELTAIAEQSDTKSVDVSYNQLCRVLNATAGNAETSQSSSKKLCQAADGSWYTKS